MSAIIAGRERKQKSGLTVRETIEQYIDNRENILSPKTVSEYRKCLKTHYPNIINTPIDNLSDTDIQKALNAEAKKCAPKTLKNVYGLLVSAFKEQGRAVQLAYPAQQKRIKSLPTPEEVFKAIRGTSVELPVLIAIWLGLRQSEIRGMRWGDIKGNILTIQNVIVDIDHKPLEKQRTKTKNSTRQIRIPPQLLEIIERQPKTGEHIITISGKQMYDRFKRITNKMGYPETTFHDLRHLNASVMLKLGIPDKYAMERGGWSTNHTLKEVYQHTFSDERQLVDDKIDDYFSKLLEDEKQEDSMTKHEEMKTKMKGFVAFMNAAGEACGNIRGKDFDFVCPLCSGAASAYRDTSNGHIGAACSGCGINVIQ